MKQNYIRWILMLVVVAATIGCDRVTKQFATDHFENTPDQSYLADTVRVEYAENTGGFLSMGADLPTFARSAIFNVGTGIVLIIVAVLVVRWRDRGLPAYGMALFVAGGASNWIDRIIRGSVVDFLNVGIGPLRSGVFNVADVAIMVGAFLFIAAEMRKKSKTDPA